MLHHLKSMMSSLFSALGALLMVTALVLVWAASCWSWIRPAGRADDALNIPIVEIDFENPRHEKIARSLASAWVQADQSLSALDLVIANSPEINAASFGSGAFVFWEGVADLPEWAVHGIAAHEVAHDVLLHSRRARDFTALTDFFAEVLSIFGGADYGTEATIRDWLRRATLPAYTRAQELEADKRAIALLTQMGYDDPTSVFVETLRILQQRYGEVGGRFFDSHPATSERISRMLRERTDVLQP